MYNLYNVTPISTFPKLWILPVSDHVVVTIEKNLIIVNILNLPHVVQRSAVLVFGH